MNKDEACFWYAFPVHNWILIKETKNYTKEVQISAKSAKV